MISKGIIVLTEKVKIRNGIGSLTFNPKFEFAPTTNIIAYYVNNKNDIVSDTISFSVRDRLPNFVSQKTFDSKFCLLIF
jgi:Alpha-2-macroglobulin bait region domain